MWVHGDDFVPSSYNTNVKRFFKSCKSSGLSPIEEFLVPLGTTIACKVSVYPEELWEWTDEGISWEADPRHAELIRKSFGVTDRSVSTPGAKDRLDDIEGETPLEKEAADRYRANARTASLK